MMALVSGNIEVLIEMIEGKIYKVYSLRLFKLVDSHPLMKLLNIGCGRTFHKDWINIDVSPSSPDVIPWDLRRGLVFPDSSFNAVYHSHVLEHAQPKEARNLIDECFRVLKHQGILRVVVPDLESIAINYLEFLEKIEAGIKEAEPNYDWMMLELYDQTTRSVRGGEMVHFLRKPDLANKEFIISRSGLSAKNIIELDAKTSKKLLWQKIKSQKISWFIQQFRYIIAGGFVAAIAGPQALQAFQEGLFRNSGEIHRWMYDRFSLRRMLERAGFVDVKVCRADESRIPDFNSYNLDVIEGQVRKPSSLFMEASKP